MSTQPRMNTNKHEWGRRLGLMLLPLILAGCQMTTFQDGETRLQAVSVLWTRTIGELEIEGKLRLRGVVSATDVDAVKAAAEGAAAGL
jgi:hypothetical protein